MVSALDSGASSSGLMGRVARMQTFTFYLPTSLRFQVLVPRKLSWTLLGFISILFIVPTSRS